MSDRQLFRTEVPVLAGMVVCLTSLTVTVRAKRLNSGVSDSFTKNVTKKNDEPRGERRTKNNERTTMTTYL